ncbi:MAG: bifunctional diaminohydroxyphosphoribosylaminopyrimidine deaminase/5-amino-6-(5-phosphoribosylamino)uracil reductase RibD [Muribaculaceae bacterium]|nr:bifunctional diaminohydroxyphosphoribosylaminopyrimidine deaminase/5-amino-6-(5-phosphoribosylamino)uracil reductase RibD [Muribaculaceae bacterium]
MDLKSDCDKIYMQRALQLARCGEGRVSPNPMVGAVIVCDGKIIGEGYHRKYGEPHAEVNAVASVMDKSLLTRSTMYVTLEPCSHYGKTPPCCNLIKECGIPRVVIGVKDPFPEVSGRGVAILKEAGVEVKVGVLENECRFINRRFITAHTQSRPYVLLKWCESKEGFMAAIENGQPKPVQLSSPVSSLYMHRERSYYDAILVGTTTAITDNPSLTVRGWKGKNPLRVAIDRDARLSTENKIFNTDAPTLVFTHITSDVDDSRYIKIDFSKDIIPQILSELYARKITSLMVEGGAKTLQSFIYSGVWDEIRREVSTVSIKEGVKAPKISFANANVSECGGSTVYCLNNQ